MTRNILIWSSDKDHPKSWNLIFALESIYLYYYIIVPVLQSLSVLCINKVCFGLHCVNSNLFFIQFKQESIILIFGIKLKNIIRLYDIFLFLLFLDCEVAYISQPKYLGEFVVFYTYILMTLKRIFRIIHT